MHAMRSAIHATCQGHMGAPCLQVRYMQILKESKGSHQPYRWVRYVTMSNSYVVRT